MSERGEVLAPAMRKAQARRATDVAKQDAVDLWLKLHELHEGEAHTALEYDSWHAYCDAEFGIERSVSYRLLDAGRIAVLLDSRQLTTKPTESQARELARLLPKGSRSGPPEPPTEEQAEVVRATWSRAVEQHDGKPTADDVRAEVETVLPSKRRKRRMRGEAERLRERRREYVDLVSGIEAQARVADARFADIDFHGALMPTRDRLHRHVVEAIAHLQAINARIESNAVDTRSRVEKRAERAMRDQAALKLLTRINGAAYKAHQQQGALLEAIERCRDRYAVQSIVDTLSRSVGWIQVYVDAARERVAREDW